MTRVVVNDADLHIDRRVTTWRDLLAHVDGEVAEHGHIVTAVRFDGVETPTYREETALARLLEDIGCVEVDAGPATELLQQSMSAASGALEALRVATCRIGGEFRDGNSAQANRELVSLAETLGALVAMVDLTARALNIDLDALSVGEQPAGELVRATTDCVSTLVRAQQAEEWVTVADGLELDVAPALDRWRDLLTELRACSAVGVEE